MPGCRPSTMRSTDPDEAHRHHPPGPSAGADRDRAARARTAELRAGAHCAARSPFRVPKGVPCRTRHHLRPAVGPGHHQHLKPRRRRTPSAAPARLQGVHTPGDRTAAHDDHRRHHRARRPATPHAGRCDVVTDIARHYPIPVICALLGAPRRRLATVLRLGRRHLEGLRLERRQRRPGRSWPPWRSSTPTSTTWSPTGATH